MAKFLYLFWVRQHLLSVMKTGSDITQNTFYIFLSQAFRCLISYYNILFSFFFLRKNAKERALQNTKHHKNCIFTLYYNVLVVFINIYLAIVMATFHKIICVQSFYYYTLIKNIFIYYILPKTLDMLYIWNTLNGRGKYNLDISVFFIFPSKDCSWTLAVGRVDKGDKQALFIYPYIEIYIAIEPKTTTCNSIYSMCMSSIYTMAVSQQPKFILTPQWVYIHNNMCNILIYPTKITENH